MAPRVGGLRWPLETGGLVTDFNTYNFTMYKTYTISRCPCGDFPVSSRYGSSCQVCFAKAISKNQPPAVQTLSRPTS